MKILENNRVVLGENELVNIFSKPFGNIAQNLEIDGLTMRKAIVKYQNHSSIKVIRENKDSINVFTFDLINPECMSKIINNLDILEATQHGDIPRKKLKDNKDLFSQTLIML